MEVCCCFFFLVASHFPFIKLLLSLSFTFFSFSVFASQVMLLFAKCKFSFSFIPAWPCTFLCFPFYKQNLILFNGWCLIWVLSLYCWPAWPCVDLYKENMICLIWVLLALYWPAWLPVHKLLRPRARLHISSINQLMPGICWPLRNNKDIFENYLWNN